MWKDMTCGVYVCAHDVFVVAASGFIVTFMSPHLSCVYVCVCVYLCVLCVCVCVV